MSVNSFRKVVMKPVGSTIGYMVGLALLAVVAVIGHTSKEGIAMSITEKSPAVALARAHVEAWSHHNWDKARQSLAADVHVTVTTTQPIMTATDTTGIDAYMEGLMKFGKAVVPGTARVIASVGDERNALLMVTVQAALSSGGGQVPLSAARLYLLDEDNKIKAEQVVFFVAHP